MTEPIIHCASFTIEPVPPYDFHLTADYATHFTGRYLWEFYEDGMYRCVLDIDGTLVVAAVRSEGTVNSPRLEVELSGPTLGETILIEARRKIEWIFQTNVDLAPFYRMTDADPFLKPLAESHRGFHVPQGPSVFEGLVSAILGQQISGQVARTLRVLLMESYGESITVDGVTYYAFPHPEVLAAAGVEGLRDKKNSGRKSEYIAGIAEKLASGEIDLEGLYDKTDDEVIETLTALRGVGIWSAHWLLVRTLGRPDGFPHGDLALQKTLGDVANGGVRMTGEEALEYSLRWSPFRTYATSYIFGAIRSGRQSDLPQQD
jgi:DNA-3-methyladenine glycosylase II